MKSIFTALFTLTVFAAGTAVAQAQTPPPGQQNPDPRQPNWTLVQSWANQLAGDSTFARSSGEQERDTGGFHQVGVRDLQDLENASGNFYQRILGIRDALTARQEFAQVKLSYGRALQTVSRRDFQDQTVRRFENCGVLINNIDSELSAR